MLNKLSIQNYALIDQLEISFPEGMTIITGETGAGKSILLGALALLLGNRADTGALQNKKRKCIIEGVFKLIEAPVKEFFIRHDLDYDELTSIRREINPEGKSRSFINDTPVTLNLLKELSDLLIEIHSQHETLTLNDSGFQMMVLDSHAKNGSLLNTWSSEFRKYNNAQQQLSELREKEKQSKLDADYFQFQFNEISAALLKEDEQELLERELVLLNSSEEIKTYLSRAGTALNGDEQNILIAWSSVVNSIQQVTKLFPEASGIFERIKSLQVELKDVASDIESLERDVVFDPERIQVISDRLDTIYRLQQKHHVKTIPELIETGSGFEKKLEEISNLDAEINALEKRLSESLQILVSTAAKLHSARLKAIPAIEKSVTTMLSELGMKQAVFKISLETLPDGKFKSNGSDSVKFLFSANKGVECRELHKIASGGELSRLMLCIKSMLAKITGLPTIIFDEIDTGISGEISHKVGKILRDMARERQVIAITHLPQMAGKGNEHLFVYKETIGGTTYTRIKKLNREERIAEIAKMLSGDQPSHAAIANAKELLEA